MKKVLQNSASVYTVVMEFMLFCHLLHSGLWHSKNTELQKLKTLEFHKTAKHNKFQA